MRGVKRPALRRRFGKVRSRGSNHESKADRYSRYTTSQLLRMTLKMARATVSSFWRRHRVASRLIAVFLLLIILTSLWIELYGSRQTVDAYDLSGEVAPLLDNPISLYADKLVTDEATGTITYNRDYTPGSDVGGNSIAPKITAEFRPLPESSVLVQDPVNQVGLEFKPQFPVRSPLTNLNRVVYPIVGYPASKVYTLGASGVKEDIVFRSKPKSDTASFTYDMTLPSGLEARLETNGSIGVYGVDSALLGNVSASSEQDANLLQSARANGKKTQLLFTIPAPVVFEQQRKNVSGAVQAHYELDGDTMTVQVRGLHAATYPLSVDPTIFIESARKLMRGNNETNVDFDVDNELIQKSQTTGARIDAWQNNLDMSQGTWEHASATAGGYVYRTGGRTGEATKPQIVGQQSSSQSTDSTTFTMNMPAVRPAGDLYVALMCHNGTGTVTAPAGGGWTEYADTREHAAYYKIGTDQGGGNEAASYTWTGSSEEWYGVIIRVRGADPVSPISGTATTTNNPADATPIFPSVTALHSASMVIRAVGVDNDEPNETGWVPFGHTKIASGISSSGGGTADCGFAAATLDVPPVSGVATGTATLAGNSLNDTYGASSIAIRPEVTVTPPQVEDSATTVSGGVDTNTFQMNMPATRPAGDLYIALFCRDGTASIPVGGIPSGWARISTNDMDEMEAFYKIGTDQGGGNEAATYTWSGVNEQWAGVIVRVSGFDPVTIFSGTPGTVNTAGTPGTFPSVTPNSNSTLVIRAIGADDDAPGTGTAWVPSGHTRISSGGGTNGINDCGFVAMQQDTAPAAGVATGTINMGNSWLNDEYGGISFAINPAPNTAALSSLDWAQFDSDTFEIDSPNPGTGACAEWCTDPTYNLPAGRRAHSMIAYNGFLYVLGGIESSGSRVSTVYIAKLGANGEPSLWHPTDSDPDNWVYWYSDTGLNGGTAKSHFGAVAYNNKMYVIGGQTNASPGGVTAVEAADILPNGLLANWTTTGMQVLPTGAGTHMTGVHAYNDTLYITGGFEGVTTSTANLRSTTYYSRLNTNGTMNAWQQTSTFTTARASYGGTMTYVWGAYMYLSGGCTAVNASGYCTTIASDTQIASINADGSLGQWRSLGISNQRIGSTLIGWQGGLYRIGGCTAQDPVNGQCDVALADVDYGVVNPAGEVSTVSVTEASGFGSCIDDSPKDCDLPPLGSGAGQGGQMLNATIIVNGNLYVIGGCTNLICSTTTGNVSYAAISTDGSLVSPTTCNGTSYGAWCVDSTNTIPGGVAAAGITTFNNKIYVVGGLDGAANTGELFYNTVNVDGTLAGAWSVQSLAGIGAESVAYTYAYARANPASAGVNPGNLYLFGGCEITTAAGCAASAPDRYSSRVYKCNIGTSGAVSGCSTSGQLQIDSNILVAGDQGVGAHAGTVYANRIYLIGGLYEVVPTDRNQVMYAQFDDNNNVVALPGQSGWVEDDSTLGAPRRRGSGFGYNGHIYAVGGYDDAVGSAIPLIEWSKIDVSDASISSFTTSSVQVTQRWGLSTVVSNAYAYVVGGCSSNSSPGPGGCSGFEPSIQTFQLYNNDSGTPANYRPANNLFNTDRYGAGSVIHNGYIYLAGGCTDGTETCSSSTTDVQYAALDSQGNIGTWASTTAGLPSARAFGKLLEAGGTLYWVGGQIKDERRVISANFDNFTSSTPALGAAAVAGAVPADSWNHPGANGGVAPNTSITYNDDTGTATTLGLSLSAGVMDSWNTVGTNNEIIFGDMVGMGPLAQTMALTNVPYSSYDVYIYLNAFGTGEQVEFRIGGNLVATLNNTFNPNQVGGSDFVENDTYVRLRNLSGNTTITMDATVGDTSLAAVQIVENRVYSDVYYATPDASTGNIASWATATNGLPARRTQFGAASWNDRLYVVAGQDEAATVSNTVYISPNLSTGGNITSAWTTETTNVPDVARSGNAVTAYANNLYTFGGHDGTNYLLDSQFTQINADGTIDPWTFTTPLPEGTRQAEAVGANGYMYVVGGRSADTVCASNTFVAPISANTTIASGNNPTGVGEWNETNERYSGRRYGNAIAYNRGTLYVLGGTCDAGFPNVESVTKSAVNVASTTLDVTMPKEVGVGDLLIVMLSTDANTPTGAPGGSSWVIISDANTLENRGKVFAKIADGTEGGTFPNFRTTGTGCGGNPCPEKATAHTYRILANEWSGVLNTVAGPPPLTNDPATSGIDASTATGTGSSPNSPNLNPAAWGTEETLWISYIAGSTHTTVSAYPASYTGGTFQRTVLADAAGASTGTAYRQSAVANEDPGAFSTNFGGTNNFVATTIAVRPAGSSAALTGAYRVMQTTLQSQPQLAKYSRMIDTDSDVFPNSWLVNGLDNSIGARWRVRYRTMHDIDSAVNPNEDCGTSPTMAQMTSWGQETNFGDTLLGDVNSYIPLNATGGNINCARYYYFFVEIDAEKTFGYPEDVNRGPTLSDLSLFFTSDPNKRLRHGKTFTGGEQQPLDTPCRQTVDPNCPLP